MCIYTILSYILYLFSFRLMYFIHVSKLNERIRKEIYFLAHFLLTLFFFSFSSFFCIHLLFHMYQLSLNYYFPLPSFMIFPSSFFFLFLICTSHIFLSYVLHVISSDVLIFICSIYSTSFLSSFLVSSFSHFIFQSRNPYRSRPYRFLLLSNTLVFFLPECV